MTKQEIIDYLKSIGIPCGCAGSVLEYKDQHKCWLFFLDDSVQFFNNELVNSHYNFRIKNEWGFADYYRNITENMLLKQLNDYKLQLKANYSKWKLKQMNEDFQ